MISTTAALLLAWASAVKRGLWLAGVGACSWDWQSRGSGGEVSSDALA